MSLTDILHTLNLLGRKMLANQSNEIPTTVCREKEHWSTQK